MRSFTVRPNAGVAALAVGAGVLLVGPEAWAQSGTQIDEVVVTARRVEENIQEVPVAVTALSGQKLEELVVNNVQDLNKLAPGLQTAGCSGTKESCAPVIRGQGNAFATGRPSVVSYFAEAPNFQVSYYDLQSLQVVKGPQGTLFGETATGGVILYSPRKPTRDFGGYVSAQGGNYDYKSLEAAVGGAVFRDILLVRAAFEYRERKGTSTGYSSFGDAPVDMDNLDRLQYRLSVVFRPVDKVENYTVYAGSRDKSNGNATPIFYADPRFMNPGVVNLAPASIPSMAAQFQFATGYAPPPGRTWGQLLVDALAHQNQAGARAVFYNYDRHRSARFDGVVNTTRWDVLENLTLKNIFSITWPKSKGPTIDVDGTDLPIVDTRAVWEPGTTSTTRRGNYAWTGGWPSRQWSNEVQALGTLFEERLEWQAGYYYRLDKGREWSTGQGVIVVFAGPQGDPAPAAFCTGAEIHAISPCSQMSRSKSETYAGFAQGTFAVTPDIRITGGYRRTWDYRRTDTTATNTYFVNFNGLNIAVPVDGRSPLPGAGVSSTIVPRDHADTYTVTGDWRVTEDLLVYAAHRTGYKGGGINGNALPGAAERVFGPEKLKDVELGAKLDWEIGGVTGRINFAAYKDWYKDIQRSQVIPGTATTFTTNLADAILQGIEVDTTIFPVSWFRLSANFSYLDAKYTRWLENRTCSSQYWRPQCAGLPGLAPVIIDHAKGKLTVGGSTIDFKPDALNDAAKYKWAIQPTLLLKELIGEDVSISANIYHNSKDTAASSNRGTTVGLPPLVLQTFLGTRSEPFFTPGRTLMDIRFDWRNINESRLTLSGAVTNLTKKLYNNSNDCGITIGGYLCAILGEPRMGYMELKYEFGA